MSYEVQDESSFAVVGITVRTSNASRHEIGALWGRFYETGVAQRIPKRRDDTIYSVYSDYESDHRGSFNVLIGCAAPENSANPDGMSKKVVSAGRYAVFPATGEIPASVVKAWSGIWDTPLDRVYGTDFERYSSDGAVSVHIGVR